MFTLMIHVIIALAAFLCVKYAAWVITEKHLVPDFLDYEPYVCYKCLGFWLSQGFFLTVGLSFHLYAFMGVGCLISALDAVALHVHEKKITEEGNKLLNE